MAKMDNRDKTIYTLGGLAILFAIYLLVRNQWVHDVRIDLIKYDSLNNTNIYEQLPSYHTMMWELTSFDVKEMIENEEKRTLKLNEMYRGLKPVKEKE